MKYMNFGLKVNPNLFSTWNCIWNLLCIVVYRMGNVGEVYSFFDHKIPFIPKSFITFLTLDFPGFVCAALLLTSKYSIFAAFNFDWIMNLLLRSLEFDHVYFKFEKSDWIPREPKFFDIYIVAIFLIDVP